MGAFYNSICVPGNERERTRASLVRWLLARGFELTEEPLLFDLEGETERCAFLVSNDRWTLVFFSKYEEERRLIHELQTWCDSLIYVWVQDSDVWGYDTFDATGFAGSFNSDPRSYRSFASAADGAERPVADPAEVCRRFGLGERAAELERIQQTKAVFKEDVCLELCRLIGAEPALTGYDDLERGAVEDLEGWRVEQMLFVHPAAVPVGGVVDLHEHELDTGEDRRSAQIEIPPEVLAEMGRRRRMRTRMLWLRPLSWLARAWRTLYEAPARARRRAATRPARPARVAEARREGSGVIEVRHLINERHRCRIRLPPGGAAHPGSRKPASVFAFRIGETPVTCFAWRRTMIGEVLRPPSRSRVLADERYRILNLKARHLLFEMPRQYTAGATGPSYLGLHVVQTERALYVFLFRFPKQVLPETARAIRATVRSFRLLDEGGDDSARLPEP